MLDIKRLIGALGICLLIVAVPGVAYAAQSTSTSYSVDEVFFGTGGELNSCSTSYCSKQAAGETAVGNTASTSYQAQAGFNSNREEYLELIVNTSNIDFGTLSTSGTTTRTATFSVKAYLASGYTVYSAGNPPRNANYTINNLNPADSSIVGTEQFGMNLVANTSPTTFGADPVQVPGSGYSYGEATAAFNTPNLYRYVQSNIARSLKSSGQTDYTISYIWNISNVTPGGVYSMSQSLVATATF